MSAISQLRQRLADLTKWSDIVLLSAPDVTIDYDNADSFIGAIQHAMKVV